MIPDAPWTGGSAPGAARHTVDGDFTEANPADGQVPKIHSPFGQDSPPSTAEIFAFVPKGRDANHNLLGFYDLTAPAGGAGLAHNEFIIEQEFEISGDHFARLPLNTPYDKANYFPDYAGPLNLDIAILVDESQPQPTGLGCVRWTRTYAKVPGSTNTSPNTGRWNTFEPGQFTFPGIEADWIYVPTFDYSSVIPSIPNGFTLEPLNDGRSAITTDITLRVQHDFFVMNEGDKFQIIGDDPSSNFYQIPQFVVFFNQFYNTRDSVTNNTPLGLLSGEYQNPTEKGSVPTAISTSPPKSSDPAFLVWGYTDPIVILTAEICVKGSIFRQWRGNIWERITCFTIAQ